MAAWRAPIPYHQVRFVYPMAVVGGEERVEVGGSTDAFEWFAPDALAGVPIVGLVAIALELPVPADEFESASGYSASSAEASSA